MASASPLLDVRDLHTYFLTDAGVARAVNGLSLAVHEGERVGLVGESGSGKSVTALSIMRLIDPPAGRIVNGEIRFRGRDLLALTEPELRKLRGGEIAMIFQDPMTSLDPVFTIGDQLTEPARLREREYRGQPADRHEVGIIERRRQRRRTVRQSHPADALLRGRYGP